MLHEERDRCRRDTVFIQQRNYHTRALCGDVARNCSATVSFAQKQAFSIESGA
jgi:hypothetical protein